MQNNRAPGPLLDRRAPVIYLYRLLPPPPPPVGTADCTSLSFCYTHNTTFFQCIHGYMYIHILVTC
jgi:hypothetical protein